jgi:hypothetical protein
MRVCKEYRCCCLDLFLGLGIHCIGIRLSVKLIGIRNLLDGMAGCDLTCPQSFAFQMLRASCLCRNQGRVIGETKEGIENWRLKVLNRRVKKSRGIHEEVDTSPTDIDSSDITGKRTTCTDQDWVPGELRKPWHLVNLSAIWGRYKRSSPLYLDNKELGHFASFISYSTYWQPELKMRRLRHLLKGDPSTIRLANHTIKINEFDTLDSACKLIRNLKKLQLAANWETYDFMIERLYITGGSSLVLSFYNEVPKYFRTSKQAYYVVNAMLEQSDIPGALALLEEVGLKDFSLVTLVVDSLYKLPNFDADNYLCCLSFIQRNDMDTPGLYLKLMILLKKFKQYDQRVALEKTINELGFDIENIKRNAELALLLEKGNLEAATNSMRNYVQETSFQPTNFIYDRFVEAGLAAGDHTVAQVAMMRRREEKLAATVKAYASLMAACMKG